MIRIRGKGAHYGEVWFDEEPAAPLPDILICRQRTRPWPGASCKPFTTLLLDLTRDEAALFGSLGKDNQYKIRRAATKEGGISYFVDAPAAELDAFCEFYDQFAATKGLDKAYRSWLVEAAAAGRLMLTRAEQQGEVRVRHAYVIYDGRARLYHSASLFRDQEKTLQAAIGRLNRWLHWQDILEFKRRGFKLYDLGGIFTQDASPMAAGINRFKTEFGGVRSDGFDCTVPLTWKGHVYLALLNLRDRFRDRFRGR